MKVAGTLTRTARSKSHKLSAEEEKLSPIDTIACAIFLDHAIPQTRKLSRVLVARREPKATPTSTFALN